MENNIVISIQRAGAIDSSASETATKISASRNVEFLSRISQQKTLLQR